MNNYLFKALRKLKPDSEFSFENDDYSTINWIVLDGKAPTQNQIDEMIEQIKADEIAANQARIEARSALLEKLGITEDEAKLLLS